jgi:hypothetical protein
MTTDIQRRNFIAGLVGASAAWPLDANAATKTFLSTFLNDTHPIERSLAVKRARPRGKIVRITFLSNEVTAPERELVRGFVPAESTIELVRRPGRAPFIRPITLPNRQQNGTPKDEIVLRVRSFVLAQGAERR